MKTLTPEEILADIFAIPSMNDWYKPVLKAMQIYAAQFQSQPSISAEDAFKQFLLKNGCTEKDVEPVAEQLMAPENELREWKYFLAGFLSRNSQGKEVEISETTHRNLCTCKHLVESYHNFCPNCGARIVWK